uniref:PK_Tyr_Ser-Thr domain-containing protein n=1 Tax=Angiostrongylus cantonensis TaxID=6313 RepID=A0A0K0D3K4_ANGCA
MIRLMVDCWHHSPHCRHTALKVKIALGEVVEDLLQIQVSRMIMVTITFMYLNKCSFPALSEPRDPGTECVAAEGGGQGADWPRKARSSGRAT